MNQLRSVQTKWETLFRQLLWSTHVGDLVVAKSIALAVASASAACCRCGPKTDKVGASSCGLLQGEVGQ